MVGMVTVVMVAAAWEAMVPMRRRHLAVLMAVAMVVAAIRTVTVRPTVTVGPVTVRQVTAAMAKGMGKNHTHIDAPWAARRRAAACFT